MRQVQASGKASGTQQKSMYSMLKWIERFIISMMLIAASVTIAHAIIG